MKRNLSAVLMLLFMATSVFAQDDKSAKRPDDVGIGDFDTFKNSAFDILDASTKLNDGATTIDKEIKGYAGILSTISVPKLKTNLGALKDINSSVKTLVEKFTTLDNDGKALLEGVKIVTPKMKSVSASNNTNKSVKALDSSKKVLAGVATLVKDNAKLLIDELKSRGETVELVFD